MFFKIIKKVIVINLIFISINCSNATNISYEVSLNNSIHHEALITINYKDLNKTLLKLKMSKFSPGRYCEHIFSANIYNLKAFDENNREIKITQISSNEWHVPVVTDNLKITYNLYADILDGTYSDINTSYALLNPPSAFIWAHNLKKVPIYIKINIPAKEYKIATQLIKINENTYMAPDFNYFMDSPILSGNLIIKEWEKESNNKKYKIIFALNNNFKDINLNHLSDLIDKGIDEEIKIFGTLPDFDDNKYTFLANYLQDAIPDGMEHKNSSVLTRNNNLEEYSTRLVTTILHEFFHSWNGKRLKPESFEDFDFENEKLHPELWFVEGITTYFSDIVMKRINAIDSKELFERFSIILKKVLYSGAREYFSAVDLSNKASLFDGADYLEEQTNSNLLLSHYDIGYALALYLDLSLRNNYNLTLDDYIKSMWENYGKLEKTYTNSDLKSALTLLTKDEKFSNTFFNNYVFGREKFNFNELFKNFGVDLKMQNSGKYILGNNKFLFKKSSILLQENTFINSNLYKAGLDKSDEIVTINNKEFNNNFQLNNYLNKLNPDLPVEITFFRNGESKKTSLKLIEDNELEIIPFEKEKIQLSPDISKKRFNWIGIVD